MIIQILKMSGDPPLPLPHPPPVITPLQQWLVGGDEKSIENCVGKRHVNNSYGQPSTRLSSAVTSVTTPLTIEGVKDEYVADEPTGQPIKVKGHKGVKEKGSRPADHTTAPVRSERPAVDACCNYRPTLTCNSAQCKYREAKCTCVLCRCLGQCTNISPQTRHNK